MLKYVDTEITFAEVPDHIALCINISNCPCHCGECHSAYLAEDIGEELSVKTLYELIDKNRGITCVSFMGGDAEPSYINLLARTIKDKYSELKVSWYSGRQELAEEIDINNFDFIKLGPYLKECGPLNYITTNQKFYRIVHLSNDTSKMYDITYKFWKHEIED